MSHSTWGVFLGRWPACGLRACRGGLPSQACCTWEGSHARWLSTAMGSARSSPWKGWKNQGRSQPGAACSWGEGMYPSISLWKFIRDSFTPSF